MFTYQLIRSIVQITFESGPKSSNQKLLEPHLQNCSKEEAMMMMMPDQSTPQTNTYLLYTYESAWQSGEKGPSVEHIYFRRLSCKMGKIV